MKRMTQIETRFVDDVHTLMPRRSWQLVAVEQIQAHGRNGRFPYSANTAPIIDRRFEMRFLVGYSRSSTSGSSSKLSVRILPLRIESRYIHAFSRSPGRKVMRPVAAGRSVRV